MDTVAWFRRVSDLLAPYGLVISLELPCPAGFVLMGIVQTLSKIKSGFETRLLVIILRALAGLGTMERAHGYIGLEVTGEGYRWAESYRC